MEVANRRDNARMGPWILFRMFRIGVLALPYARLTRSRGFQRTMERLVLTNSFKLVAGTLQKFAGQ